MKLQKTGISIVGLQGYFPTISLWERSLLVGAVLLMTTCGGPAKHSQRASVCFAETKTSLEQSEVRSFWPEDWFDLLLHDFDSYSKIPDKNPLLCTRRSLVWPDPRDCGVRETKSPLTQREPIGSSDLVFAPVNKDERLVWGIARRYESGEAIGPVALVKFSPAGVSVKALGPLRAAANNVSMKLMSTADAKVLLVEGELCDDSETACPRYVRALVLLGQRFSPVSLTNNLGECQGPAYFPLTRSAVKILKNSTERRYEMSSRVTVVKEGIIVHEQLTIHDADTSNSESPPRLRRDAEIDRLIRVVDGRLIPESASLWAIVDSEIGAKR